VAGACRACRAWPLETRTLLGSARSFHSCLILLQLQLLLLQLLLYVCYVLHQLLH